MRNIRMDHYKGLLILLVVIGHAINAFSLTGSWVEHFYNFIYFFHMPAFFFVSGYFHKTPEKAPWDKAAFYFFIGITLRAIVLGIQVFFDKDPNLSLVDGTGVYWFAFVMAYYQMVAWVVRNRNPLKVAIGSMVVAVIVGYIDAIGTYMHLSRAFVFFPFFYVGMKYGKKMTNYMEKHFVLSKLGLVLGIIAIRLPDKAVSIYAGRKSYADMELSWIAGGYRLAWIAAALIFVCSLYTVLPRKEWKGLTYLGKHTLPIYFWHRIVLYVLSYSDVGIDENTFVLFSMMLSYVTANFPLPIQLQRIRNIFTVHKRIESIS